MINFRCDEELFNKIVKAMKTDEEKGLWAVVTSESGMQAQKLFTLFDDCYKAKEYVDALCISEMSEDLGYWLIVSNAFRACSKCGVTVPFDSAGHELISSNYCPGCGSKMMRIDKL